MTFLLRDHGRVLTAIALPCIVVLMLTPEMGSSAPLWANTCSDGRVDTMLDDFESTWTFCCKADPSIPDPHLSIVPGCHGQAMAVGYDLTNPSNGASWIALQRSLAPPMDLSNFTHLRLAIRGLNVNSHDNIEVKLWDGSNLYTVSLKSMTDLPVWRPIYVDLREFTGVGTINLKTISRLEIAVVRCVQCEVFDIPGTPAPAEQHIGALYLDEFAAVDLKPGAVNRLVQARFETVVPNPTVRSAAARALFDRVSASGPTTGMIPAWFPEPNPNYNTYVQAEALLVFIYEYEQTHDIAYKIKASDLADKLLSLQIPSGRTHAGAWYTTYVIQGGALSPPNRALPSLPQTPCDGNETMVPDPDNSGQLTAKNIDVCEWVGNVGWVLIALGKLQRSGFYNNPSALQDALDRGAAWVVGQFNRNPGYSNLISLGTEGNISAYFGLLAASKGHDAALLGNAIFQFAWDPIQRRLKPGVRPADAATAIDVSGSWGVTFLRSIGQTQEALDSQAYAVSVLRTSSFDGSILGYGDIAGPHTPAVEFLAQAAAAGITDADFVMQQIYPLQQPSNDLYPGAFPGAPDHWYGGALTPWNTTMPGVSPTAWVFFASNDSDPLLELVAQ